MCAGQMTLRLKKNVVKITGRYSLEKSAEIFILLDTVAPISEMCAFSNHANMFFWMDAVVRVAEM